MVRRVRSAEGSRYYDLPIGAPITADALAKARLKNGGKPAPKNATYQSSAPRSASFHRSQQAKESKRAATASRKVSPEVALDPPPRKAPKGPAVKTGSAQYKVKPDSKTWSREGSPVKYNVDAEGNLRVLTPQGEARLDPAAEARVKALMVKERESLQPEGNSQQGPASPGGEPDKDAETIGDWLGTVGVRGQAQQAKARSTVVAHGKAARAALDAGDRRKARDEAQAAMDYVNGLGVQTPGDGPVAESLNRMHALATGDPGRSTPTPSPSPSSSEPPSRTPSTTPPSNEPPRRSRFAQTPDKRAQMEKDQARRDELDSQIAEDRARRREREQQRLAEAKTESVYDVTRRMKEAQPGARLVVSPKVENEGEPHESRWPDQVYRFTGAGWGREWTSDGLDPRDAGISEESLIRRLSEMELEGDIGAIRLESKEDMRAKRRPNSLGESHTLEPKKVAAMAQSPLTGKHVVNGELTAERRALHDKIISDFLDGVAPVDNPVQYMNGGGPASGKGTMTRGDNARITGYPPTHIVDDDGNFIRSDNPGGVIVDPDQLKLSLPEAREAVRKRAAGEELTPEEAEWARNLHEESSYLGKRLTQAALDRGVNVILDGVNDGAVDEVRAKVAKARDAGYTVEANYIYTDPEAALERARLRGERSGRVVPTHVILEAYQNLPGIFDTLREGTFDKLRLFDNNGDGNAKLVGEGSIRSFDFVDNESMAVYERFLESARLARLLDESNAQSGAEQEMARNLQDMVSLPSGPAPTS